MMWRVRVVLWVVFSAFGLLGMNPGHAQTGVAPAATLSPVATENGVVNEAAVVLQELTVGTLERIPERLLQEAYALAIIPHAMRGALVVGVSGGRGVLVSRGADGRWQAPEFVSLAGGSVGWQLGVQSSDVVMVFRTPRSVESIRRGKLTLGGNASVAAGPVGRDAGAATDTSFQAEILTYARSRGLFAGISFQGSALQLDIPATQRYYQLSPGGPGTVPQSAQALIQEIIKYSANSLPAASRTAEILPDSGAAATLTAGATVHPLAAQLSQSVSALQSRVDEQWRQYLSLPQDWFSGRPLTVADLQGVAVRYERIETNPQYANLRSLPEYQQVLTDLRKLLAEVAPAGQPVVLPPPPSVPGNATK
jgi:lipid-binding SYLF domain-containing protein